MGRDRSKGPTMCYHDAEWLDAAEPAHAPPEEDADDDEGADEEKVPVAA